MTEQPDPPAGRPLAIDGRAESADPALPAFLARPAGAPVYHGFPVIDGFESDSFRLGMITGFLSEPAVAGDAYVIARMGVVPGWSGSPADTRRCCPLLLSVGNPLDWSGSFARGATTVSPAYYNSFVGLYGHGVIWHSSLFKHQIFAEIL